MPDRPGLGITFSLHTELTHISGYGLTAAAFGLQSAAMAWRAETSSRSHRLISHCKLASSDANRCDLKQFKCSAAILTVFAIAYVGISCIEIVRRSLPATRCQGMAT